MLALSGCGSEAVEARPGANGDDARRIPAEELAAALAAPPPAPTPVRLEIVESHVSGWVRDDASGTFIEPPSLSPERTFSWTRDADGDWELEEISAADNPVRETSIGGFATRYRGSELDSAVDLAESYGPDHGPGMPMPELGQYGATLLLSNLESEIAEHPEDTVSLTTKPSTCFGMPCTSVTVTRPASADTDPFLPINSGESTLTVEVTYLDDSMQTLLHRTTLDGALFANFEVTTLAWLPADYRLVPGDSDVARPG